MPQRTRMIRFAVIAATAVVLAACGVPAVHAQASAGAKEAAAKKTIDDALRAYDAGEFEKAYPALKRLARNGSVVAKYRLSKMYAEGKGVPNGKADAAASLRYLREAAALNYARSPGKWGLADAQYDLGKRYANGDGVTKTPSRAVANFTRAAKQGHSGAMAELPAYFTGEKGVKANAEQGYEWSLVGARMLDGDAKSNAAKSAETFRGKLSTRKQRQVEDRVKDWQAVTD
jgi:uncharacterized protein